MAKSYFCSACRMYFTEDSVPKVGGLAGSSSVCPICQGPLEREKPVNPDASGSMKSCILPSIIFMAIAALGVAAYFGKLPKSLEKVTGTSSKKKTEEAQDLPPVGNPAAFARQNINLKGMKIKFEPVANAEQTGDPTQHIYLEGKIGSRTKRILKNIVLSWEYELFKQKYSGTTDLGTLGPTERRQVKEKIGSAQIRAPIAYYKYTIEVSTASVQ